MIRPRGIVPPLALLCVSLLVTAACATAGAGAPLGMPFSRSGAPQVTAGPTKDECTKELPVLEARLAALYRERLRIREKLTAAGFERTSAESIGDGTAAPGLALEALRSADALEKQLEGLPTANPGLGTEIDWIAANWFDPVLMRWTSAQIRSLTSLTAEQFRDLKTETKSLREMLPNSTSTQRRIEELRGCPRRKPVREPEMPPAAVETAAPLQHAASANSAITCGPETTRVGCKETVTVESRDAASTFRPLDSSSLTSDELRVFGPDASAWIAFARAVAGIGSGAERVYVDGMPAMAGVPASMIGRISVNGDPFTVEYSGVGETRIDINLVAPERRWRGTMSSPSFGFGGGSPLGQTGTRTSRNASLGVSGPIPRMPVTLSFNANRYFDARQPLFVTPESGSIARIDNDLQTTSSSSDLQFSAAFVTSRVMARAALSDSRMQMDHAGIGGTNGPTTGQHLDAWTRSLQTSWRLADGGRIHRGGFSFRQDRLDAVADSVAPLSMITGQFATGGDELAFSSRRTESWTAKHVVEMATGALKIGVEGSRETLGDQSVPNPLGRFQFSSLTSATATWIVSRGRSTTTMRSTSAALFGEHLTMNTPRMTMRSGLRLDWQNGAGVMISPRVVASARVSAYQISGGAGLFVQSWSPDLFVMAAERDGAHGTTFVVHDVVATSLDEIDAAGGEPLRTSIALGFERRRDLILRGGIQRRIGPVQTGIEHTWTRGQSLPGAVRVREANGLVDYISSDRTLRRHQSHVRASAQRGANAIMAYYQHVWSFDDSDGPAVTPARQGDVRGEWGRSAGVTRHAVGITGLARLPEHIHLALTLEARSGMPYTVLTGFDADGLATFTDRGGRARNSGTLPSFCKISLSASRTVRVPSAAWLVFDVGVRADNLTNRRNVTSVGRVVGSPTFGVPLDATAGRSIRIWASLAR